MALLAMAFVGTSAQAAWQLLQSSTTVSGEFVEVAEARTGIQSAIYSLVLRTDQGELIFVRLRNNGRILNYLLARGGEVMGQQAAVVIQGSAATFTIQGSEARTVREARIPPAIQLLIGVLPLLILVLHIRPNLLMIRKEG
jgi:hypothetical protein